MYNIKLTDCIDLKFPDSHTPTESTQTSHEHTNELRTNTIVISTTINR